MNNLIEKINNLLDEKEKLEIIDELNKINVYKNYMYNNGTSTKEINDFISKTINKYSYKKEVFDYYLPGKNTPTTEYDTLCIIEKMIYEYIVRKQNNENNQY